MLLYSRGSALSTLLGVVKYLIQLPSLQLPHAYPHYSE